MNADYQGLAGLMKLKGRQGDTQLVHMSPMEVKALDALAPGGLTTNPSTGLPEAFKLKDLLPALGAVAGGVFLAPLLGLGGGALAAGLGTGLGAAGGTALAGGNKEEILTSGLLSGVTAGMLAPGADKAAASGLGIKEGVAETGKQALQQGTSQQVAGLATPATGYVMPQSAAELGTQLGYKPHIQAIQQEYARNLATMPTAAATGLKGLAQKGFEQVGTKGLLGGAAMGALTSPSLYDVPAEQKVEMFPEVTGIQSIPAGATKEDIDRYIRQGGTMPRFFNYRTTYAAEGGSMGDSPSSPMFSGKVPSNGEGDGMSDNVEFQVVGDPQIKRALLSPDEYVVDAHTVAMLGNGSSDAGAKALDRLREDIRKKATGSKEQPKQISAYEQLKQMIA